MQPLNVNTFQLGLIGYPLTHSLSPQIHTAALQSGGLNGNYYLFPIPHDDTQSLEDLLSRVRSSEIHGLNVTIPHKQNVIQHLDELTTTANSIGAVNTIYLRDNKLMGDNTDAPGFLSDLTKFLATHLPRWSVPGETQRPGESSALVLGAGGSARAVVYALINDGWEVVVAARRTQQANELADQFENVKVIEYNIQTFKRLNIQLIVNTTPIGMTPNIDQSPWPQNLPFPRHASIYDLVYNPRETKLVQEAHKQGSRATTGLGMLIEQAALSFKIWTGQDPSRETMRAAAQQSPISNNQLQITNPGAS